MKDWIMGLVAGLLASVSIFSFMLLVSTQVCAQTSWENNPLNYKNSLYNFDNSQYNYKNSPYNWENSPYNIDSKNGIFNNQGDRIGYEVKSDQGTRNIYDNNGNRIGYQR
jgi:hypothetical protein